MVRGAPLIADNEPVKGEFMIDIRVVREVLGGEMVYSCSLDQWSMGSR